MKNLLLSSFVILVLTGCTFGHYRGLKEVANANSVHPKPIFGDNFSSFLFKTNITVYGKDFSGLLVTKQMTPQDYRVIFTTELGMKLFDFEFKDTAFTLHYCVPMFNKPKLLKLIQQDIETLLMNNLQDKSFYCSTDSNNLCNVQRLNRDKMFYYYFIEKSTQNIVKIEYAKKRFKKTIFTLSDYKNNFPNNIRIKHCDIKLLMELNLLKK